MPAQIYEDTLEISIGLLETQPLANGPSYPFPLLRPTGKLATRTFRTLVIENPFLRITIVPALGGRILRLFDKRANREVLAGSEAPLVPSVGGRRGVRLPIGIQLRLDGEERLNSLGPVAFQIEEASEDSAAAGVWLAETACANGLAFHLFISMPANRAEILIEARVQNRTFRPIPYDGEISAFCGDKASDCLPSSLGAGGPERGDGIGVYDAEANVGMAMWSEAPFDGARLEQCVLRFARFGRNLFLAPRQVDAWTVRLIPFSGLGDLSGWSTEAAAFFDAGRLRIQSVSRRAAHKIVLQAESGETLESTVDLHPEHVLELPLAGLPSPPRALAVVDSASRQILRAGGASFPVGGGETERREQSGGDVSWPTVDDNAKQLLRATFHVGARYLAHTLLGVRAMREGNFAIADGEFEQALMFNADDPLLWWEKALSRRLMRDPDDTGESDAAELLNAHYLAPLEPALRAEAFLGQKSDDPDVKNPLLAGMADMPEEFVEAACLLIEHGRMDLAAQWIGAALEHADLAMLHLLLAFCLLQTTRLDAEAADRVSKAGRVPGPPFPWRDVEWSSLRALAARFPGDARLASLLGFDRLDRGFAS